MTSPAPTSTNSLPPARQPILSYDPSPLPHSIFRSDRSNKQKSTGENSPTVPQQTLLNNNDFHSCIGSENILHTFSHAYLDPTETLPSRITKFFRKLQFHSRIIETQLFITTHRVSLWKEIVTGDWRRRSEQQEFLSNLRRIEVASEVFPRFWFDMLTSPLERVFVLLLGMWLPLAWDTLVFTLALILSIFVRNLTSTTVIVTFCILTALTAISRIAQIAIVGICIWRLSREQQRNDATATMEMTQPVANEAEEATPAPDADTAQSQSAQPALIQKPFLYFILLFISLLCNVAAFGFSFLSFTHANYACLVVAIITSLSSFFSCISIAVMPKFSNRYPTTVKLYFSEINSNASKLVPDAKLSDSHEYAQRLVFFVIVGFLLGWIPGAVLAAILFYVFQRQPEDLGYLCERNDRVLSAYLSFRDAQQVKSILWRLRSNDVKFYGDAMLE